MRYVRVFKPTVLDGLPEIFERAIENTMTDVAEDIRIDFLVTVETWTDKPRFHVVRSRYRRLIYTEDTIYLYVSGGTQPHLIVARNAKALVFYQGGFRPKTRVRAIRSNVGRKADQVRRVVPKPIPVHHPGTEAREFDLVIAEKWRKQFPQIMQRAINAEVARLDFRPREA